MRQKTFPGSVIASTLITLLLCLGFPEYGPVRVASAMGTLPNCPDSDGDGYQEDGPDCVPRTGADNCPLVYNPDQTDTDGDGFGNVCDNCVFVWNGGWGGQADNDGDGLGNACDIDDDNDGVPDEADNCRWIANADQLDTDDDEFGNACDTDDDNDGMSDEEELAQGRNPLVNEPAVIQMINSTILDE